MANTQRQKTEKMVGIAILTALVIVLQVLSTVIPMPSGLSITLTLVPIVVGSAIYGPNVGGYLGLIFGIVVMIVCFMGLGQLGTTMIYTEGKMFVCVLLILLKGFAAGFCAGWVYKLVSKKNSVVASILAGIVSPVVNTAIFMAGSLVFYGDLLENTSKSMGVDVVYFLFIVVAGVNFLIELGINLVLNPAIIRIIHVVKKDQTKKA